MAVKTKKNNFFLVFLKTNQSQTYFFFELYVLFSIHRASDFSTATKFCFDSNFDF